jgi:SAM-dependent methyltransferase
MTNIIKAIKLSMDAVRRDRSKLALAFSSEGYRKFVRILRRKKKTAQQAAREQREKQLEFASEAWVHRGEISQRRYDSYETYSDHQRSKLDDLLATTDFSRNAKSTRLFRQRFELATELRPGSSVLCLAARIGSEVEAFISLGHFAIGIDLNPGPKNPYVVVGDFHALVFADRSVDCVYTNSLDHAFDLEKVAREVSRVLKPGGIFMLDAVYGYQEGYTVGNHDAVHWATVESFAQRMAEWGGFKLETIRDLGPHGSPYFKQCILTKPGPSLS